MDIKDWAKLIGASFVFTVLTYFVITYSADFIGRVWALYSPEEYVFFAARDSIAPLAPDNCYSNSRDRGVGVQGDTAGGALTPLAFARHRVGPSGLHLRTISSQQSWHIPGRIIAIVSGWSNIWGVLHVYRLGWCDSKPLGV
jgi:hypothetical protein